MQTPDNSAAPQPSAARQPLEKSEQHASKDQPGSYDKQGAEHKTVGIPPVGPTEKPIKGLDNRPDSSVDGKSA